MLHSTDNMAANSQQERIMEWIKKNFEFLENAKLTTDDRDPIEKNILLLGRTKSGKTTLLNMIRDPTHVSNELSLLSKSGTIQCETIKYSKPALLLRIVDTKGLSGSQHDGNELLNIHEAMTKFRITSFHLVCYCLSFEAGIRQQDITTLKNIIDYYGEEIKPNLCMIITRCESKIEEQRRRMCTEIEQDCFFGDVVKQLGQGIHFSGSLNYDDWHNGSEALCNQFLTIYNYRVKLMQLFSMNIKPFCIQTFSKPAAKPICVPSIDQPFVHHGYRPSDKPTNRYVLLIPMSLQRPNCFFVTGNRTTSIMSQL
jgi:hypothetical protein